MRKIALIVCIICMLVTFGSVVMADDQPTQPTQQAAQEGIPNYTELPDEDSNGRAVHLDADNEKELNPVEQKVIQRDTIQSNPTLVEPQ